MIVALSLTICAIVIFILLVNVFARYVFLSPGCFSDNDRFTEKENYFIKKLLLEAVEDRWSVLSDEEFQSYDMNCSEDIVQLYSPSSSKKLFTT